MKTLQDMRRKDWILLATVLLTALIIRLIYLYFYQTLPDWEQLTLDNYYHHNWALSLVNGNPVGDTTYFRAPFYIYCLALVYKLFSISLWSARLFGLLVGLLTVTVTYFLGRKIFDHKCGLVAATAYACYPYAIYFETELLLVGLFTLLLTAAILSAQQWNRSSNFRFALLTGLLLGLASITRPTALALIPVLGLYHLYYVKGKQGRWKGLAPFALGLLLIIGPIFVRNLIVAQDPVLISSQGGINFYIGNNEIADGSTAALPEPMGANWRMSDIASIAEKEAGDELKPGEVSSFWTRQAVAWISNNPSDFAILQANRIYFSFLNPESSNNRDLGLFFDKISILSYNPLSFGLLFMFAVFGFAASCRANRSSRFLAIIVVIFTLVVSIFFLSSRFRQPLIPMYAVLASYGLLELLRRSKTSLTGLFKAAGICALAGLFTFLPLTSMESSRKWSDEMSKGLFHLATDDYPMALTYFHKAEATDSTLPEVNMNIGVTYLWLGNADSSAFYLEREIRFNPLRSKTYTNLASLHLVNQRYDSALAMIQIALDLKPRDVVANMVWLRVMAGADRVAIDSLFGFILRAAKRTRDDIYLLNEAGKLLSAAGDFDRAELIFRRALLSKAPPIETDDEAFQRNFKNSEENLNKQRSETYYQLGFMAGLKNRIGMAIEYSQSAIQLDSTRVEAYVNLINGYLSAGRKERAVEVYDKAIVRFPTSRYLLLFDF